MGSSSPTWFLAPHAPNFDCSPGGYLSLGSLISRPLRPDLPISSETPLSLPESVKVDVNTKKDWKQVDERRKKGRLGLWAKFVELVNVKRFGANWSNSRTQAYHFEVLEIHSFNPPKELIRERMSDEEVVEYIGRGTVVRPKVFMITAIMIARNPNVTHSKDRSWGFGFDAGVDLGEVGVPGVTAGTEQDISSSRHQKTSAAESQDFVFAYRLSRIMYGRKKLDARPYVKGAAHSNQSPQQVDDLPQELDLEALSTAQVEASDYAFEASLVYDDFEDDKTCHCVAT